MYTDAGVGRPSILTLPQSQSLNQCEGAYAMVTQRLIRKKLASNKGHLHRNTGSDAMTAKHDKSSKACVRGEVWNTTPYGVRALMKRTMNKIQLATTAEPIAA